MLFIVQLDSDCIMNVNRCMDVKLDTKKTPQVGSFCPLYFIVLFHCAMCVLMCDVIPAVLKLELEFETCSPTKPQKPYVSELLCFCY